VKHADAVVLWRGEGLREEICAIYQSAPRLAEVSATTLPEVLNAAAEVVASD